MSDLVSVLISAYNQENFIERTIRSFMAQTYADIELIVLDDGSKDKTFDKICALRAECEKRFVRFVAETQQNEGYNATLRRLFAMAGGKFVYLSGADDIAYPDAIAVQAGFLSAHEDYAAAICDAHIIDDSSHKIAWDKKRRAVFTGSKGAFDTVTGYYRHKRRDVDFYSDSFGSYASLLKGNYIAGGFLARKDALGSAMLLQDDLNAEWFLHLQIAKEGKYKFIDTPQSALRWHGARSLKRDWKTRLQDEKTLFYEADLLCQIADDVHCDAYADFLENGNKKTLFRLGSCIELYRQKFCLQKCTVLKIGAHLLPLGRKSAKSLRFLQECVEQCRHPV